MNCWTRGFDVQGFLHDVDHALHCRSDHELEVYIWCYRCGHQVETSDDTHCGFCGTGLADKAPPQFYVNTDS